MGSVVVSRHTLVQDHVLDVGLSWWEGELEPSGKEAKDVVIRQK